MLRARKPRVRAGASVCDALHDGNVAMPQGNHPIILSRATRAVKTITTTPMKVMPRKTLCMVPHFPVHRLGCRSCRALNRWLSHHASFGFERCACLQRGCWAVPALSLQGQCILISFKGSRNSAARSSRSFLRNSISRRSNSVNSLRAASKLRSRGAIPGRCVRSVITYPCLAGGECREITDL